MPSKMQQRQKLRRENVLTRGQLDAQVLTEQGQQENKGSCTRCERGFDEQCPQGWKKSGQNKCTA